MTEERFKHEMNQAKTFQHISSSSAYWQGYQRGLRRAYHGSKFGTQAEHELWMNMINNKDYTRQERGKGYLAAINLETELVF